MPKYVKLIAKPDTWFKAGTEVFDDDCFGKRYTLEAYNQWLKSGIILARGIRVCELVSIPADANCKVCLAAQI
jgi:hypothetical protein